MVTGAEAAAAGLVDADGDGVWDGQATTPVDTDMDGVADYLDLDSDNDGIPDAVENQPTDGFDGTGYVTPGKADADGDGVVDAFDDGTSDHGGSFNHPVDTDGDGVADYLDSDSDNDGIDDTTESGITLSGMDADGDGIDDALNASYCDPDGDISAPINDLENNDSDATDVDFRSENVIVDAVDDEFTTVQGQPVLLDPLSNDEFSDGAASVSYTHLTLPTIYSV